MFTIHAAMVDKPKLRGSKAKRGLPKPRISLAVFLVKTVARHSADIVSVAAQRFGISRQAVHRQLARLIATGKIHATGNTRSRRYTLPMSDRIDLELTPGLDEDKVWREHVRPRLDNLPDNVRTICQHGFTEIFNNVLDHSGSSSACVVVERDPRSVKITIKDWGIGIFEKIRKGFNLASENQAVAELMKGKVTTDPERHTGLGIFFTSRMFDAFRILSGRVFLACTNGGEDWTLEDKDEVEGTFVLMTIRTDSNRTTKEVFDRFAAPENDYSFDTTHLVLRVFEPTGDKLISRSQAKRVLARLESFKKVMLDFKDVPEIGPAFADEIFRVFALAHPDVEIVPVNASDEVMRMVHWAMNQSSQNRSE
jgi:anti-sigma regulatory factor (Ser/Thr protein kinase)